MADEQTQQEEQKQQQEAKFTQTDFCLLYTSDAADD